MLFRSREESGYNTFGGYASRTSLSSWRYSVDGGVGLGLNLGGEEEDEEAYCVSSEIMRMSR